MINYSCIEFTSCNPLFMSGTGVYLTQVENKPYIAENFMKWILSVKFSLKNRIYP